MKSLAAPNAFSASFQADYLFDKYLYSDLAYLTRLLVQRHQHLKADPFRNCNFVVACHVFANLNSFLLLVRLAAFSRA